MKKLQEYLDLFGDEPWLRAGVAVVLGFLAAYVVDFLVRRVLKALTHRTKTTADDQLLALFHRPVRVTVVLIGLWIAIQQFGLEPQRNEAGEAISIDHETWIGSLLKTLGLLAWTGFAFKFSKLLLQILSKDRERVQVIEPSTLPLFDNLGKIIIFGGACYLAVIAWGGDAQALIASAGVAGIAIGFAAKDTLANLFSGVFIVADSPYKLGDYIVLDSGERGKVINIGLRSTRLLTRDDIEITIPNAVMGAAKIMNETGGPAPSRRVRIPVGVAYGSDIDLVKQVLQQVAEKNEFVQLSPDPRIRFRAFGDSALNFELLGWIQEPELRGRAVDALLTEIYKAFAENNIEIAFPQLDVHLHKIATE
ncbi:MAG: mechanosensitive ion channel family protein [Planctomycetes bacterium]|nr:mechanosensitive ion channel family protein [Planctomycetota bacterium]